METLQGVHHFYGGIGMVVLGLLLIRARWRWAAILGLALAATGPLVMLDDIYQHTMQRFVQPGYASPCKVIYHDWSRRCGLIKRTVITADRLFRHVQNEPTPPPTNAPPTGRGKQPGPERP
jgi:hypothetical protein